MDWGGEMTKTPQISQGGRAVTLRSKQDDEFHTVVIIDYLFSGFVLTARQCDADITADWRIIGTIVQ